MSNEMLMRFDFLLDASGPVAIVVREDLEPVEGADAVFFPPTFAPPPEKKGEPSSYVVDTAGNSKTAIVDTAGAQANRMEPLFKREPYAKLVPKAEVKIGERSIDLLEAGHRAADAVVRYSDKGPALSAAFRAIGDKGDATELAKLAPTSLVFGCWDSRDTQVKLPRLVGSRVRAYGVAELTRAAQYFSPFDKEETEELMQESGLDQKALSERGFSDAPAGRGPGGVTATGGIRRDATLNLIAVRALAGVNAERTLKLQRYILGLSMIALLAKMDLFLREGCLLVSKSATAETVERNAQRKPVAFEFEDVLAFAEAAAVDFGVGENWTATFSKDSAKEALTSSKSAKKKETATGSKAKKG